MPTLQSPRYPRYMPTSESASCRRYDWGCKAAPHSRGREQTVVGHTLYVANTDAVLGSSYTVGDTRIAAPGTPLVALPAGAINRLQCGA